MTPEGNVVMYKSALLCHHIRFEVYNTLTDLPVVCDAACLQCLAVTFTVRRNRTVLPLRMVSVTGVCMRAWCVTP